VPVSLVIVLKVAFLALKVYIIPSKHSKELRLARFDKKTTCIFVVFLCAACLPTSLIMLVPFSELCVQWNFSMSLKSQRFLQFHPTVMLVAYF